MYREEQLRTLFEGKKILVAGYGREGQSTHRLVDSLCSRAEVVVADGNEAIAIEAARGYDLVMKSPGVPMAVLDGLCPAEKVSSQADIFLQVFGDQTIGVTGTKGKSTTASLIHHVLTGCGCRSLLAGNIGVPLLDIVPQLDSTATIVAELSCHQLENIKCGPHIAILLNLFQEHLDHYRDYHDYQMAKMQIALRQHKGDCFFYSTDNADLCQCVAECHWQLSQTVCPYSQAEAELSPLARAKSPLAGAHNLGNAYVAMMATSLLGVTEARFEQQLATFAPLEHRMELVGTYGGVTYYNDSISTIPAACIAALEALPGVETLILGGYDRGIDYGPLAAYIAISGVRNIAFVGQAGRRIAQLLAAQGYAPERSIDEDDYGRIVAWCAEATRPGAACLLSPAAASYDAFKNFEQRGTIFKQLVRSLNNNAN
ncbi:MAG: UDP-N-acetylmuramoyl-L-alanine--D-glutamate ligase [Bacteroidales bacterium]|nr:UDP-N-acetylmuramoyl-L-alanine--D-glutamate ligase [Bacteroidales bacterium]